MLGGLKQKVFFILTIWKEFLQLRSFLLSHRNFFTFICRVWTVFIIDFNIPLSFWFSALKLTHFIWSPTFKCTAFHFSQPSFASSIRVLHSWFYIFSFFGAFKYSQSVSHNFLPPVFCTTRVPDLLLMIVINIYAELFGRRVSVCLCIRLYGSMWLSSF